jgi:transcriptional repressor NrdR
MWWLLQGCHSTPSRIKGMHCPFCGTSDTSVVDSRFTGEAVRRRRLCRTCERRFTTYERHDQGPLYIRKRDGSREAFDRAKVLAGLERAAIKRPVEREQLEGIVDRVVAELRAEGGAPSTRQVGDLALRGLRDVDPVAYIRFASVYRQFADLAEFERELERLAGEPPLQREHLFETVDSVRVGGQSSQSARGPGEGSNGAGGGTVSDGNQERVEG